VSATSFGALFQFIRNGMNIKQDKSGNGIPITRIETIADAVVDPLRVGYADLTESDCQEWLMEPGDILFSHINSVDHIGKCAVYRGDPIKLVHGMNLLCLRCDTTKLLPEFAKYVIRGSDFRSRLSNFINKAVNQASVSIGNLKTISVTVPPTSEQRRIVKVLDRAEALRANRRAALAQLDTLTQSIFLDLFGEADGNPKGWPIQPVSDYVTDFQGGRSVEAESGENPATLNRVLKVSAVTGMKFLPHENKPVPDGYQPPLEHFVKPGDLLFSRANTTELVGAVAYVDTTPSNLLLPDKLWRFVWRQPAPVIPLFVWALFQTPHFWLPSSPLRLLARISFRRCRSLRTDQGLSSRISKIFR
jgi:hypothetical protein